MRDALTEALNRTWTPCFEDDCTQDWQEKWFLDGKKATIAHSPEGMTYAAGPELKDNSESHAVLWTKQSFAGNVKIEFDYTRLDDLFGNVNILYLLATGIDDGKKDILTWAHEREVAGMGIYLRQMNMYHISFAAHREKNPPGQQEYCRARYYPVTLSDEFHGTDLEPDYWNTGVFLTGKTYHITAVKTEQHLFFHVVGDGQDKLFAWDHTRYPLVTEGRIGFRHMACRSSRYAHVEVSTSL